jgi:hypothetical protein
MTFRITVVAVALALGCVTPLAPATFAAAPTAEITQPSLPQPGPEHQFLKDDEGQWDAVVEVFAQPGEPPMQSKGVETNRMGCGGLCLITDFKSDLMGLPFEGHGTTTWNPSKKKYVGSWSDSMSTGLSLTESTWDPATKTVTGWIEGPDPTGNVTRMKSVVEYKDSGRVFSAYAPGPDGKDVLTMKITYTRKK